MQESSSTYLFNMWIEGHILVKNEAKGKHEHQYTGKIKIYINESQSSALTEGLLEVRQARHLWSYVVQMGLQSTTDQQGVGQVSDVNAHNGKRIPGGHGDKTHTRLVGGTLYEGETGASVFHKRCEFLENRDYSQKCGKRACKQMDTKYKD